MSKQEYREGDLVNVHYLPDSMSHFDKGLAVIVRASHNQCQEGTDYEWDYALIFIVDDLYDSETYSAWYNHFNLEMIEKGLLHRYKLKGNS